MKFLFITSNSNENSFQSDFLSSIDFLPFWVGDQDGSRRLEYKIHSKKKRQKSRDLAKLSQL